MISSPQEYFRYLASRSRLGLLYRNCWLYPRICSHLTGRVLDVGCGIGDFLRFRKQTTGTDINPDTVQYCKSRGLDVVLMNVDRLPFQSERFDGVLLDNVLEHIGVPKLLLEEVYRVLKPTGTLMVGVPGRAGYLRDHDHKVFYSYDELVTTLLAHGFICNTVFFMPIESTVLDRLLPQYCLYATFTRN